MATVTPNKPEIHTPSETPIEIPKPRRASEVLREAYERGVLKGERMLCQYEADGRRYCAVGYLLHARGMPDYRLDTLANDDATVMVADLYGMTRDLAADLMNKNDWWQDAEEEHESTFLDLANWLAKRGA